MMIPTTKKPVVTYTYVKEPETSINVPEAQDGQTLSEVFEVQKSLRKFVVM
jgi:hypothetical protein